MAQAEQLPIYKASYDLCLVTGVGRGAANAYAVSVRGAGRGSTFGRSVPRSVT